MKTRFFKSILCLCLAFVIALPLVGCKSKTYAIKEGKYVDTNGVIIADTNVTLDFIAQNEYRKNFDDLESENKRRNVVSLYLEYHLPASSDGEIARKNAMINQLSKLDVTNPNIAELFKDGVDTTEGVLSDASNALALAEIYSKIKKNKGFEEFVGKLDDACSVVNVVTNFSKACLIVVDLSNNDISNKQEYCDDVIDALTYITSYVPFFDNYFEQTLKTVKVGVQTVIKQYDKYYGKLPAYDAELGNKKGFFSIQQFEFILDSKKWDSDLAPSIADILDNSDQFHTIPAGQPFVCLKEYILYRISVEQTAPQTNTSDVSDPDTPHGPTINGVTTWLGYGKIHSTHDRTFNMCVSKVSGTYISGDLSVYTITSDKTEYTHRTDFEGVGTPTEGGIIYTLKFKTPVTFGISQIDNYSTTCAEMNIFYSAKDDTFTFDYMYHVTMERLEI